MATTVPDGAPVTKSELKAELQGAVKQLRDYIDERTRDLHMKADLGSLNTATDERLAALETRVANFEKRLIERASRRTVGRELAPG